MIEKVSDSADGQDRKEQCGTIQLDQGCKTQKNAAPRLYHKQKRTCQENKYYFFSPDGQQITGINKRKPPATTLGAAGGVHRRPRMSCPHSYQTKLLNKKHTNWGTLVIVYYFLQLADILSGN